MERISNIISKKVVSIEESLCVGYVLDVCVDTAKKMVEGYLVCDESNEVINFLSTKNMLANNDYIIIKNINMLEFGDLVEPKNPIGKEVLDENGFSLGRIIDFEVKNGKILKLISKKCEINPKHIIDFNGDFLIFSQSKKKPIKKEFNFKNLNKQDLQKVEIQSFILEKKENLNSVQIPFKSRILTNNLLGRILINDVFGLNNELIGRKNEIINEKIIKKAKSHNKVNHLFFNSK